MTTTKQYFKVKNGLEFPRQDALTVTDDGGPSIRPSLLLDFAKSKKLDPRITFTRSSTGTYYDGDTTAVAEQNLITNSNNFTDVSWQPDGATVVLNSSTAPDGTNTAALLSETAVTNYHDLYTKTGYRAYTTAGLPYTMSIYVKRNVNSKYIQLAHQGSAFPNHYATFDIENGIVLYTSSGTASIINAGNGWYRLIVTDVATLSGTEYGIIQIAFANAPNSSRLPSYAGSTSNSVYIWGAQIEQRSFATAYTPTTTSPITNYIPVLQTATANTARFDHDPVTGESKGLLIEEARSNLTINSSDFSAWTKYNNITINQSAGIAPDGTLTATKLIRPATTGNHYLNNSSASVSGTFTLSVYAKAGEWSWLFIQASGSGSNGWFNLSTGTIGATTDCTASIVPVGNGWYRCSITDTTGSTVTPVLWPARANGVSSDTGDGVSGIYIWGAQLENGAFATSYIPTPLTYTGRGSTATYKAADGLIRTAQPNVARYEPNASGGGNVLLESSSSNQLTYTEQLVGGSWSPSNATIVPNATQSPSGAMNGVKIVADSTNSVHGLNFGSIATNSTYTVSFYVKGAEETILVLANDNTGAPYFYTSTGTVASASGFSSTTMTAAGGGWWKCSATFTSSSTASSVMAFRLRTNSSFSASGNGLYIWGVQIESGGTSSSYIPSTETHTGRSSTATYYDSTGTIRTAASGQPRYTYNPSLLTAPPKLLLEGQATNLIPYSEDINGYSYGGVTLSSNQTTAPDGNNTADKITITATGANYCFQYVSSWAANTTYTASVWIKNIDCTGISIGFYEDGTALPKGVVNVTSQVNSSGWTRVSTTTTTSASGVTNFRFYVSTNSSGANTSYYVWGAQVEIGYTPSSYIPTTGAAVTRAADTSTSAAQTRAADVYSSSQVTRGADAASITGTKFSSWYNVGQGSFYGEASLYGSNTTILWASNGTGNNFNAILKGVSSVYQGQMTVDGTSYTVKPVTLSSTDLSYIKYSSSYDNTSFNGSVSGSTAVSTTIKYPPIINQLGIGQLTYGTPYTSNGWFKKIAYYPKRLTNAELQSITS